MKQLEEQILVSCVCCFVKNIIPMRILSIAGNTLTTNMHRLLKVKYNSTHLKKIRVGAIHNNMLYTEIINDISREFTKDQ